VVRSSASPPPSARARSRSARSTSSWSPRDAVKKNGRAVPALPARATAGPGADAQRVSHAVLCWMNGADSDLVAVPAAAAEPYPALDDHGRDPWCPTSSRCRSSSWRRTPQCALPDLAPCCVRTLPGAEFYHWKGLHRGSRAAWSRVGDHRLELRLDPLQLGVNSEQVGELRGGHPAGTPGDVAGPEVASIAAAG